MTAQPVAKVHIIDGQTYDLGQSELIAEKETFPRRPPNAHPMEDEVGQDVTELLYRTPGNSFVIERKIETGQPDGPDEYGEYGWNIFSRVKELEPISREGAHAWQLTGHVKVYNEAALHLPPHANPVYDPEAPYMFLPMPKEDRQRLERLAAIESMTVTAYILRQLRPRLQE